MKTGYCMRIMYWSSDVCSSAPRRSPCATVHPAENFVWLIVEFNGARCACDRRRDLEHLVEDDLFELRLCKIRCTILDRSSTNPSGHIEADFLDLRYVRDEQANFDEILDGLRCLG